jgi:DNA-binding transcriptional regulator LsrR (DeoR family)
MIHTEHPPDEQTDLIARAAWYYYVAANNQERTGEILGVNRTKVTRLLSQARELGLVKISIEHRLTAMFEIENRIAKKYGLDFCIATPPLTDALPPEPDGTRSDFTAQLIESRNDLARRAVGIAGARYLKKRLEAKEDLCIGLAWGRTLAAMADQLFGVANPALKFVSLMGSLTRTAAANPFEVVHRLSARTGGEAHFLPVPYIANSVADKNVLLSQQSVQESLALARSADFYIISVGECDEGSLLFQRGLISGEELMSVQKAGAVCDTIGKFFDASGNVIDTELNDRTLAVDLADVRGHEVVLLCAGLSKLQAVKGLLSSGLVDGLVIDGDVAGILAEEITMESKEKATAIKQD